MKTAQDMLERMEALVRKMANAPTVPMELGVTSARSYQDEARAIVAELPAPVDPDLLIAPVDPDLLIAREVISETYSDPTRGIGNGPARVRRIVAGEADQYWEMRAVLAAVKRGRELAHAEYGGFGSYGADGKSAPVYLRKNDPKTRSSPRL